MNHTVRFAAEGEVEQRIQAVEKYLESLQLHRDSRRGLEGVRGEKGDTGSVGATGAPADPQAVAEIAANLVQKALRYETQVSKFENLIKEFESEIVALRGALKFAIIEELQLSGFVDAEGRAVPGPAGRDSHVQGIPGVRGDSGAPGQNGHDAQVAIGRVSTDDQAGASIRVENGVSYIDLVLPRAERGEKGETGTAGRDGVDSVVQGPVGPEGREGIQGIPGPGLSKSDIVNLILDMKKRGSI